MGNTHAPGTILPATITSMAGWCNRMRGWIVSADGNGHEIVAEASCRKQEIA